jgi:hypothetical protein
MEQALATLGYTSLVIARPSLLAGDRAGWASRTGPENVSGCRCHACYAG